MVEVFCHGCARRGQMERVGVRNRHSCGSYDVDLWLDDPEQRRRIAVLAGRGPHFSDFMTHEGASQKPMPPPTDDASRWPGYVGQDPEPGWDEYEGPMPGPNPMPAPVHSGTVPTGLTKHQPGTQTGSNIYVYDKTDPGSGYGENAPTPLVAPQNYPSTRTKVPFVGARRVLDWPLTLTAACPRCGSKTALKIDRLAHVHWTCQARCGHLVDLDRHPTVDPYVPPPDHPWGSDPFRTKKIFGSRRNGQLKTRMEKITDVNPGLTTAEVVRLARHSVIRYPEA